MSIAYDKSDFRHLKALWSKWTRIISQAALPAWRRRSVSDEKFAHLRQSLLRICSDLAHSANREQSRLILRMHELVEPWPSPKSLHNVDQKYLAGMIVECHALDRELAGRSRFRRPMPAWLQTVLLAVLIAGLIWFAGGATGTFDFLAEWTRRGIRMLRSTSFVQRFAMASFAVIAGGIFLLHRTKRF